MPRTGAVQEIRLAELVAALSLATDLGLGLPSEHVLRQCRIALGLAGHLGVDAETRAATYYVALLAWVGCTSDSHELAALFGDERALRASTYEVDMAGLSLLRHLLARAGAGRPPHQRARAAAGLLLSGGGDVKAAVLASCEVASMTAERLGLGPEVCVPLQHVLARWDGRGSPAGAGGEDLPLAIRLVHLADIVEVHHRAGGVEAALAVARRRSGGQFDPRLVEVFGDCAADVLGRLDDGSSWEAVIAAQPGLSKPLAGEALDRAVESLGLFADVKSPWFTGHSAGVADLAGRAARIAGLPDAEATAVMRAGHLHDLGRASLPNTILDKAGPLSAAERERVRLASYCTERILARPPALARLGAVACAHGERLDGSGYHRSVSGGAISPAQRVLGAAAAYRSMTEDRPWRPALTSAQAGAELRTEVRAARLDGDAVDAVLAAAGHPRPSARERARPAGLTARELEVLVLIARGASARDVAGELVISPKTARNHVERIYAKLGVSTRAAATYFAMRHGLVD